MILIAIDQGVLNSNDRETLRLLLLPYIAQGVF
jgi:hypothetical protein